MARKPRRWSFLRLLRLISVRAYTALILAVVLAAGYFAFAYLLRSVFKPLPIPQRFLEWQAHLDASSLRQGAAGLTGPAPRAPLSHYHKVDRWFQVDSHNTCTLAGCHLPLPHGVGQRASAARPPNRVAAFANLHVTFMDCAVCHEGASGRIDAQWVALSTGQKHEPPPMLRLAGFLEQNSDAIRQLLDLHTGRATTQSVKADVVAMHGTISGLLRSALTIVGGDPVLDDVLLELDSSNPGSPVWVRSLGQLVIEIPRHTRGEYGAKLARTNPGGGAPADRARVAEEVRRAGGSPTPQQWGRIHTGLLPRPEACLACHSDQPGMLDLEALGYSPKRAASLRALPLARKMQDIREGGEFELPRVPGRGGQP
jgi:hypothetical protein